MVLKLRTLITILSIMAVMSSGIGGYLYYTALIESSKMRVQREAVEYVKNLRKDIDFYLKWSLISVKSLSGLKELKQSLSNEDTNVLIEANTVLGRFRSDLNVSVCYLMNQSGNTIASSNYQDSNSFIGTNYGFRPYFKKGMQGIPVVYMALGVTSKKRGIYYSHPVYDDKKEKPLGIAVLKTSVEKIEKNFRQSHDGIVLLTDPHGMVFLSNRTDWLYKVLWKVSSEVFEEITLKKQFGKGPWSWTGMKLIDESNASDKQNNKYQVHQQELVNYPGWNLVYLVSVNDLFEKTITPLQKSFGIGVLVVCIIFGLIIFYLFTKANSNIIKRKRAEEALQGSEEKYRVMMETIPDAAYICSSNFIIEYMNPAMISQIGHDAIGETCYKALHGFNKKCSWCLHYRAQKGEHFHQTIINPRDNHSFHVSHSPIQNKDGSISKIAVFRDITELLQSEEKLKQSENKFKSFAEQSLTGVYLLRNGDFKYVNPKFAQIFGYTTEECLGKMFFPKLVYPKDLSKVKEQIEKRETGKVETVQYTFRGLKKSGEIIYLEIFGSSVVIDNKLSALGTILDISDRKLAEQEREKLVCDLQKALKDVKQLSGLIPICSNCKKIRDDKGYWNQIEKYISEKSDVEFSHGICSECSDELYGKDDWYIELKDEENKKT